MNERYGQAQQAEQEFASDLKRSTSHLNAVASAATVNRTHRVVRERAKTLQEQKNRIRSLWIPLTVSFGMLALVLFSIWNLMDESEMFANGIPDSSQQMLVITMWCLPVSVILLAVVWFRLGTKANNRSSR
jgi:predicted CDP-diglyceride synthetase/phosphatidate cytidylyltransferase